MVKGSVRRCDLSVIYDLLQLYKESKDSSYYSRAYDKASAIEESNWDKMSVQEIKENGYVAASYLIDVMNVCIASKKTLDDVIIALEWLGWDVFGKVQ